MTKEEKTTPKKSDQIAKFEADAANFKPTPKGCGTLVKAKRKIKHLMRLKDIQTTELDEGEAVIILYDFVHQETKERALVLLLPDEQRHMYMTTEFDEDFEVLHVGTQEMLIGGKPLPIEEEEDAE